MRTCSHLRLRPRKHQPPVTESRDATQTRTVTCDRIRSTPRAGRGRQPAARLLIRDPLQPYRACSEIFTVVQRQTGHHSLRIDAGEINAGFGDIRESAIERMSRDARVQSIGGGATEVMLEEIAKRSVVGG